MPRLGLMMKICIASIKKINVILKKIPSLEGRDIGRVKQRLPPPLNPLPQGEGRFLLYKTIFRY